MENEKKLTIEHLFWYFVIFSILGLVIETLYCYASTGVLESRKGLIWGPLCPVYGVCGTFLVYMLYKLKCKSTVGIFAAGVIIGSISEYFLSYALEAVYGTRFWNYEYLNFNINGRISLLFSLYWGILSILIMKIAKPLIDKFIARMNPKTKGAWEIGIFIFLCIDCVVTIWGIQTYQNRVLYNKQPEEIKGPLSRIRIEIENNYFTNERMSRNFPNLRVKNEKGEEVWIKTLLEN